jgi:glycosyltransferase involved in cell wall biosynthesis
MTSGGKEDPPGVDQVTWQRIYADREFGIQQRVRLLVYLVGNNLDVDIYHFLFVPTLLTSFLLATVVGLKRKHSVQTVPSLCRRSMSPTIARKLFFADRVIALSDWTGSRLRSWGIEGVVRINAGINLDDFTPPTDRLSSRSGWGLPRDKVLALFSGELSRLGSLEIILAIAPRVLAASPDLHLVFASPTRKPEDLHARREAKDRICRQGFGNAVTFLGDVHCFADLLNACDMLLFPVATMTGKIDTPLTVLEAMATGLPVVLTDLPPLNEVLKADGGIATPPGDYDAFAEAILEMAHDGSRRREMGMVGRNLVEQHYDARDMVNRYDGVYHGF